MKHIKWKMYIVKKWIVWLTSKKTNSPTEKRAKDLNRHLPKGQIQRANMHVKGAQHHVLREVEREWGTSACLLEQPQFRAVTTPDAGGDVEQQELAVTFRSGVCKWCSHLGRQLAVSYRAECSLTVWFSIHTSWYLPKGIEYYVQTKTCMKETTYQLYS